MITPELLSFLLCPACQEGRLTLPDDVSELRCDACDAAFSVQLGFPTLIPPGALTGPEWELWRRHLERFSERRRPREDKVTRALGNFRAKYDAQPAFAEFVGIDQGTVLDLGCGPGKFRRLFAPERVTYVGLDPLALPEVGDFHFVQGVAEYLPFNSGTFSDIVILAALDHFRDLDRFAREATRVLAPGGRLHVLQSIHEVRGPGSAVRVMAHALKDSWDNRNTASFGDDVPKHISEFTESSLLARLGGLFEPTTSRVYSRTWYSPLKLFISFARVQDASRQLKASA
jgi:SAM-dependent methyltransferase